MLKTKLTFIATLCIINTNEIYGQVLCNRRYLNDEIRIDGKVVIVTGGTSGLGLETAHNLASRGGRIYLASRGEKRGKEAAEAIRRSTGYGNVQFMQLDLGSLRSVRKFSETFRKEETRLDILINNAGLASHYNTTEDGFELNMGVNHLGHFLLTNLLLDLLKASVPSRIIVVSSIAHWIGIIERDNLNSEIYFPGIIRAYSNSKLANVLFAHELARRLENTGVTVNSLDPGFSVSALGQNLDTTLRGLFELAQTLFGRNSEYGSQTHVMLAIDPIVRVVSGKYFLDCVQHQPAYLARDANMGRWLWEHSEKLTRLNAHQMVSNVTQ
ncbi:retinol dehydrogenase 14-like [Bradysia coprophila]|uniref:retinol dehydrogenase 14-like n=1 Tax=Bradysia coprophila TaxID=38358 RepID=UPI00187DB082|nr:retinol dehydrogenase 14-like [Bradysia coprophila]